ncbi:MAG: hypothetical protein DWQ02_12980 [Bacteroidetes bacterium]|nr:MAG: hypothetical protein DWQ02_12980 [Bacteroidota bacterium]
METFLEIIKVTVPALIVFLTVYYLLKKFIEGQERMKMLEIRESQQQVSTPMRLQAYERLSLFCERISIPNLVLRLNKQGLTAAEFQISLLLAIQQEYEHNITQQVYVSEKLWDIIKMAKDDAVNFTSLVAESVDPKADATVLAQELINYLDKRPMSGPDQALLALKKEASLIF